MTIDKEKIDMVFLEEKDIDDYLSFIHTVKSTMEHPEWLGDFSKEDLSYLLNHGSYLCFFKYQGMVVASSLIIPAREKDIQKFELDLPYQETMDYGPEGVLAEARGNGLQLYVLQKMDELSKEKGYKYAVSTVHPDNIFCIRNMEKHGFIYHQTKEFTRGVRNIYQKDIK